ncbi:metalloprotease [Phaffia rhodozyma]|uniref:Metalloprotease n=1 Tax=Phaffia rhodozyma TaxID=264483 RepID=A0A0F7SUC1_PHARH|nr:metalloprotease [Phaffia rhodozyma]
MGNSALFVSSISLGMMAQLGVWAAPSSHMTPAVTRCGTTHSNAADIDQAVPVLPRSTTTIDVYFHVISESTDLSGGYLTSEMVNDQIGVLNDDYASSNFGFSLISTDWTVNSDWFNNVGPETTQQAEMKAALRKGGSASLNLYTSGFKSGSGKGLLGYATFPSTYASAPKDDGVVVLFSSLPGGSTTNYNLGRTAVHEIGHWLGLYHTFQGGCSGDGDFVSDTPSEGVPTQGCPVGKRTCPGSQDDLISNFMDYSYDSCMTGFTLGQAVRMDAQVGLYRGL